MKFGAEYMNNPLDEDSTLFQCKHFSFYQPLELENKQLIRVLYVDPSKGKKGKGRKKSDYSGFADVLVDTQNRVTYLLNAFRKRLTPNAAKVEVVNWFAEALKDKWACEFWIEENSFGDILGENFQDELRRRGIDLKVNTLLHTTEKSARIERLSIRVDSNGFRFPNRWENEARQPEWFNELLEYPFSTFDDVVDALESADFIGTDLIHGKIEFLSSRLKLGSAKMGGY
jgi:predicted phage terminase large subunit-like protein